MLVDVSKPLCTLTMEGARVSFLVPSMKDAEKICETMATTGKPFEIELRQKKKKRTLSSNALLWAVLGDMALALQKNDPDITPESIYRNYIIDSANYIIQDIYESELPRLKSIWESNGVGWQIDVVDVVEDGAEQKLSVRLFYGSSQYDQAEFSALVNIVLQDASAIGIEHTSDNVAELMRRYPNGQ